MMGENTFLWSCVWQGTVCVGVGLVGSFVLRRRPARAHQMLLLAMIVAVIVPVMSVVVKHFEWGMFVAEPVVSEPVVESRLESSDYEMADVGVVGSVQPGTNVSEAAAGRAAIARAQPAVIARPEKAKLRLGTLAIWGWVAASLALYTRLLVTFALGVQLLGRSSPSKRERIQKAAEAARAKLGIDKAVAVCSSDKVRGSVIWCWSKRPVLLVPSSGGETNGRLDWVSIVCHELAHWKRRDHISGLLAELVVCIMPWNPLLWLAKQRLVRLSEQACDDWVVAAGQSGTDYAESLLDLAPQGQMLLAPAVVSSKSGLGDRVRRILQDKCSNPRTGVWWALAVSIVAACMAVGAAFAQSRPGKPEVATSEAAPVVPTVRLYTLPAGWRLDYDDGTRAGGGRAWRSGMAKNLLELRVVPTPANEYDESWTQDRIEFRIFNPQGELMDQIHANFQDWEGPWCSYDWDHSILAPDKYRLIYLRGREDPKSGCTIPLNRVEFPVDLSRHGMYQLKFRPKLETSKTAGPGKYAPTTCTGKIIDTEGNLVVGAKVAAYELFFDMVGNVNLRPVGAIITKSDGNFLFETSPSVKKRRSVGGYVVAIKEGLALGWAEWPLYSTQQVTITLGTPMKLGGMVVDESGAPVPKAEIRALLFKKKTSEKEKIKWLPGIGPLEWLAVKSDNRGRFQFGNIPSNVNADLIITASGLSTIYTRKPDQIKSGYEGASFVAGKTDIKITMPAEARIEGKVVDKETGMGIAGATLAVTPYFTGVFFGRFLCTSKEDGTFSIGGLRNGKYLIRGRCVQGKVSRLNVTAESGKTVSGVIIECPHMVQDLVTDPNGATQPADTKEKKAEALGNTAKLGP